jgi:hypothetical protein
LAALQRLQHLLQPLAGQQRLSLQEHLPGRLKDRLRPFGPAVVVPGAGRVQQDSQSPQPALRPELDGPDRHPAEHLVGYSLREPVGLVTHPQFP